jgi:hypothetical protein
MLECKVRFTNLGLETCGLVVTSTCVFRGGDQVVSVDRYLHGSVVSCLQPY